MNSTYNLTRISDGCRAAIHSYFDLCPESPDGARVVYFQFDDSVPGPGGVVVAQRDGSEPRVIASGIAGHAHTGAYQQWVGDNAIAYASGEQDGGGSVVVTLSDGAAHECRHWIRMYSPASGVGLSYGRRGDSGEPAVSRVDWRSGDTRWLFDRSDALAMHPLRERRLQREPITFKHTKWAPDGQRFFCVLSNEPYIWSHPGELRIKSLYLANADGSGLRYLTEFGHHPMWGQDSACVYYFERDGASQSLVVHPLDGAAPRVILAGIAGVHATLSPDQRRVVTDIFGWPEPGRGAVVLYEVADGRRVTLAEFELPDTTHQTGCHPHPVWSRDAGRVYFNAPTDGRPHVWAVEAPA
jgi:hypothetical protein